MTDMAAGGLRVVTLECTGCRHQALHELGQCATGDRCVVAMSGRQIDRFFRANPDEAAAYLDDGFWERRAIAARYAPLDLIDGLMHDPDEVVRRVVAGRIPDERLMELIHDPDRDVRAIAVQRLPGEQVEWALRDIDYLVRMFAVRKVSHGLLRPLIHDPEREVRKAVAQRLPPFALGVYATDPEPEVRRIAASRMLPADAARLLDDDDWSVRLAAVNNAPLDTLAQRLAREEDEEIRGAMAGRLGAA
ncbi:MAG: (Fe-S) protein [Rhodocyclales bacterium]|nr:(Fe-S) protein [Rhodocyclales bacterium]